MMPYKLYCLDGEKKIAGPPQVVEAESDQDAIGVAEAMMTGSDCELWHGGRLVAHLPRT